LSRGVVMRNLAVQTLTWGGGRRRSTTEPVFDSRIHPQFVGLRAVGRPIRRALFQIDGYQIDFEVTVNPSSGRARLAGHITGARDGGDGWLRLSRGSEQWLVRLDESGEFRLDDLVRGPYRLELALKDRMIEVPVLPL
jgi:hypothetical protein